MEIKSSCIKIENKWKNWLNEKKQLNKKNENNENKWKKWLNGKNEKNWLNKEERKKMSN